MQFVRVLHRWFPQSVFVVFGFLRVSVGIDYFLSNGGNGVKL